jgi:hypothetical protein
MELVHSRTGLRGTLSFIVTDLTGAGPRVLTQALRAPKIPQEDESWPGIETLLVQERRVTNLEGCTSKWKVTVTYGFPEVTGGPFDNPPDDEAPPILEVDSSVVMKRTNIALDENDMGYHIMFTDYFPLEYDEDGVLVGISNTPAPRQGGMVDVPVVVTVLRYRRREPPVDSHGRGVGTKARQFTGRTNSHQIGGDPGDPPGTWLCSRIGADTDDAGQSYNVTYEFQHNPDSWDPTIVYIDPKTGQPGDGIGDEAQAQGADLGNGVKVVRVTRRANFESLNLYL